jgi:agmatinase
MSGPADMVATIECAAAGPATDRKLILALGGEHTITLGVVRACARVHGPLSILQIDAHADLRDSYEGTPYSHACVARRLLDWGTVTAVGIRSISEEEHAFVKAHGHRVFWARDVATSRDDAWIDEVIESLRDPVYVTFDLDGLDPALVPATGTPEPGGLSWYPTLELLRRLGERRHIVGCDIVELMPIAGHNASDFLAARLAYKMIGFFRPAR